MINIKKNISEAIDNLDIFESEKKRKEKKEKLKW